MTKAVCKNCGKQFTRWRNKEYCSERCRKQAENIRLRTTLPDKEKTEKIPQRNQSSAERLRGAEWSAINEVTQKLAPPGGNAIAWAMYIGSQKGWFGRIGEEWSFGPTSMLRVRQAIEAHFRNEPFEKREGERSWRGDCMAIV
jgi:hypothetical protein